MQDEQAYRIAKQYVERKIGFFIHLAVYAGVNAVIVFLNLVYYPHEPLALGPLLGWGIGLLFHGLTVFLHAPGSSWKQRMIKKQMKKQQSAQPEP